MTQALSTTEVAERQTKLDERPAPAAAWGDPESGALHWAALAAIFAVALFLRVAWVDSQGLWYDEALTIVLSKWSVSQLFLLPTDPTPPLYYLLHKIFLSADSSLGAMRSISIVAGVASVGLMYVLGRISFGARGGLFAAALLSVWGTHVDYSQEARAYSLFFLLTLLTSVGLALYGDALSRERGSLADTNAEKRSFALLLFGAGNVLSFYTHLISVFWITLTSLLLIAVVVRERRIHLAELFAVFFLMAVGATPGVYRLAVQFQVGSDFTWLPQFPLRRFLTTNAQLFLGFLDNQQIVDSVPRRLVRAMLGLTSIVSLALALWFARRRFLARFYEHPAIIGLVVAYLAVPLTIWLFGFVGRPIFMLKAILFCLPGFILLVVGLVLSFGRAGNIAGIGLLGLVGASTLIEGTIRLRDDWSGAYQQLASAASADDLIAICARASYPVLSYAASAPVSARVLVMAADNRLLEIEKGLGTNPDWDDVFFSQIQLPDFEHRLGYGLAQSRALREARLTLQPGQSIWRVDGHCFAAGAAKMDKALSFVDAAPAVVWVSTRTLPPIIIRRYIADRSVDISFDVISKK